jgi:hypothetical protein
MILVKAFFLLIIIRLGLWLLPFRTLQKTLERQSHSPATSHEPSLSPEKVSWAVSAVSPYVPSAICLKSNWTICHPLVSFSDHRRRKKEPHNRVLAGILVPFGVNYRAEFTSIAGALVAHGRGANLPYFGKQTII